MKSMESPPKLCSFLYISCLILFLCSFSLPLSSASPSISSTSSYGSHKVSLKLYYESLCPYSANFIVNYLVKLFDDDLISIVDLRLVPYGNARVGRNDSITCQVLSLIHYISALIECTWIACSVSSLLDLILGFPLWFL